MRRGYRTVLCRGDVLSALAPYVLARLPLTMAPLALLLLVQSQDGSYRQAGVVSACYAVAVAVASPLLGRLVDRQGQAPVLLACGIIHPAAMVGTAFAADARAYPLVIAGAMAAGASLPPVTACMRVLWGRLLPDEQTRTIGFAIEGIIVEVAELAGPLLISVMLVLGRPVLAVALSGLLMGASALTFRFATAEHGRRVPPAPTVSRLGALASSGVRRLLFIVMTSTATIGALEVAVSAYARHHGGIASAGLYIAGISVGGVAAGVLFGRFEASARRGPALLAVMLIVPAAAAAALAGAVTPGFVVAALVVFGATVSIGVILQLALMSSVADEAVRAEAFTWGGTANLLGLGAGTAGAGWAVDKFGISGGFLVAGLPTLVAATVTLASLRIFRTALASSAVSEERAEAGADSPNTARVMPDLATLAGEMAALKAHVADLEAALSEALRGSPTVIVADARERAQRMLDRADAACLEMRDRATDDADRVRSAATTASIEVLAAAERDARAMLERARREADGIVDRARRSVDGPARRPMLHALPDLDRAGDGPEVASGS